MPRLLRENGLSLAFGLLFLATVVGQVAAGYLTYQQELAERGALAITLLDYLRSGHFLEALFENWESEFLQMGMFVVLAEKLRQRGSSESKKLDGDDHDEDPHRHQHDPRAPWPVRHGGLALKLYAHSLLITFGLLFAASFALHAFGGAREENATRALRGAPPVGVLEYVGSPRFWFESMQNWQSEFLAILAIVLFTIFLRERGSPQSKPVAAPHSQTGQ